MFGWRSFVSTIKLLQRCNKGFASSCRVYKYAKVVVISIKIDRHE